MSLVHGREYSTAEVAALFNVGLPPGHGRWTVLAIDRELRRYAVAQDVTKAAATRNAAAILAEQLGQ